MLLVIDYINFGTCLTILTRHPTIFIGILGPDWFKRSGCSCGSLQIRVVAVFSGFKRFVRLIMRLEIGVFAEYL